MAERPLDLVHLQTFLAVAQEGSFTKAAERVSLTQSAVSRQMKDLERSLGAQVFERFGRGVNLTAAGKSLLKQAQQILIQEKDIRRALAEIEDGQAGELRLGATITAANDLLPPILAVYRRSFPQVRLVLNPASTTKLLHQLRRNELDFAVLGQVPQDPDLKVWCTFSDEIVLVAAPDHPLVTRKKVSAKQIASQELVLRDPHSDLRQLMEQWAKQTGIRLLPLMDMW